jgi:hypothetical protein
MIGFYTLAGHISELFKAYLLSLLHRQNSLAR